MKISWMGDLVRIIPESHKELRGILDDLDNKNINYQVWVNMLIVIFYQSWLKAELKNDYEQ